MTGEIPEQDDIIHTCRGDILAGRMQVEGHDGFFVSFEGSDETGVLFVIHGLIFKLYEHSSSSNMPILIWNDHCLRNLKVKYNHTIFHFQVNLLLLLFFLEENEYSPS